MSIEEAKSAIEEHLKKGGFDALYREEVIRLVASIIDDAMVWNPVRHWLREKAKDDPKKTVSFVDDWVKAASDAVKSVDGDASSMFAIGDHVEIAERLSSQIEKKGPVVYDLASFWQYRGDATHWQKVDESQLYRAVCRYSGDPVMPADPSKSARPLKISDQTAKGVINVYQNHVDQSGGEDGIGFFDEGPDGIMYDDVFVRVGDGEVIEETPTPEHRQTISTGVELSDGTVKTPIFDRYLSSIFKGDPDAGAKQRLLMEFAAACMAGIATRHSIALVLYDGTDNSGGSNGKSVFVKILHALFPQQVRASVNPTDFDDANSRASLAGKRVNFVTEMPDDSGVIEGQHVKAVISGDPISAKFLYQDVFFFRPTAGHIFACNNFPSTRDTSDAFWRRWVVVPFNRRFVGEEKDPDIVEKIVDQELEGVARLLRHALKDLVERGHFLVPDECERAKSKWRRMANNVLYFLIDECRDYTEEGYIGPVDPDEASWTKAINLYKAYRAWARQWGFYPVSGTKFGTRVSSAVKKKRKSDGTYYQVSLKPKHARAEGQDEVGF